MRRAPLTVLVPVLVAAVVTACAGEGGTAEDGGALVPALCTAIDTDDSAAAATVFEREVHAPLHDLADEVTAADRAVTTALLEAKYEVEAVVRDDADAPDALVRQRLEALAEQVRVALETLDRPAPRC